MQEHLIELAKRCLNTTAFVAIALPGAIGGLTIKLLGVYPEQYPIFRELFLGSILSMVMGAAAGLVLVVILTNSDRSDKARLVTLSFLAGIVWTSVVPAGLEVLGVQATPFNLNSSIGSIDSVVAAGARVSKDLDEGETGRAIHDVNQSVRTFLDRARETPEFQDQMIGVLVERVRENLSGRAQESVLMALRSANVDIPDPTSDTSEDYMDDDSLPLDLPVPETILFENLLERILPNRIEISENEDLQQLGLGDTQLAVDIDGMDGLFNVYVPAMGRYVISAESVAQSDLVATLYGRDGIVVTADDDSGENLQPKIEAFLNAGEYILRVSDYYGSDVGQVNVTFGLSEGP